MFIRQAIASFLQFFVVLCFFSAGLFFSILSYLPLTRGQIATFFLDETQSSIPIAIGFFLFSLFLGLGFYGLNRGRFLVIKMGVSLDLKLIQSAVQTCFEERFSKRISLKEIDIGPKSLLDFQVSLEASEKGSQEELFKEVEKELSKLLQKRFGYTKPFYLIAKTGS